MLAVDEAGTLATAALEAPAHRPREDEQIGHRELTGICTWQRRPSSGLGALVRCRVGVRQTQQHLGYDPSSHLAEVFPTGPHLRLLEHVVSEGRLGNPRRLAGGSAEAALLPGERLDAHVPGDCLAGR
jgi:hypothetical protein